MHDLVLTAILGEEALLFFTSNRYRNGGPEMLSGSQRSHSLVEWKEPACESGARGQNLSPQTPCPAALLPALNPVASSPPSSSHCPPPGQQKGGFYSPTSSARFTMELVSCHIKNEWGAACFECHSAFTERDSVSTSSVRRMLHLSHSPLQRNSGNC